MISCRCRDCFGLAEHMLLLTGKNYGLKAAPGHSSANHQPLTDTPACDQSMTCPCKACATERSKLVVLRHKPVRQPWEKAA